MKNRTFRAGDQLLVKSPEEILSTLDADGTLDGVPFMPEMIAFCGKPFHILRRVEKTCVDGYPMRRFPADDVVILDGPRCDGSGHDGCKHRCRIFWKEAWLEPANADTAPAEVSDTRLAGLGARLKVKSDAKRYFCQSTELYKATESFSGNRRLLTVRIALREIRRGDLSVVRAIGLFCRWILQKWLRRAGADEKLRGPRKQTVNEPLNLKPGDKVRIKDRKRVVETLNHDMRNRGLGICYEMTRCCGRAAEVRYHVDRLIDEKTGVMRHISNTVALNVQGSKALSEECLCRGQLGDCPRGEVMYWREVWLERS